MPKITEHTRNVTIVRDEVNGITQILDQSVTIYTDLPDDPLPRSDDHGDDIPPSIWDRFKMPPRN
ncbi:MAG TPA: hypothetical protein VH092_09185 [Urbifossiella sp.]|nr:hypothetical protein [Urbifossiella sp.]